MNTYEILIDKLDTFIRKFYLNKMIRGVIYFVSALFITYLLLNTLEYFLYLSATWKTGLLLLNLAFLMYLFVFNFLIPLLGIYKLGKIISYQQAAEIIGKHFPKINDKIINTLQLQELAKLEPEKRALIFASIDQRIVELKPVPFVKAIDINKNKKYLKYAKIPISIFIV